ncbi:hypothetical protein LAYK3_06960 [Lactobacillus amylovorus subsp. amylovorus]|nr:hypothetical protein LAYK3_06960 [Lactobacillus amylovorus]
MNKFIKVTAQTTLAISLLLTATPLTSLSVNATAVEKDMTQQKLSLSTQKRIDPYIAVKNNQYVLSDNATSVVSRDDYIAAKQLIAQANIVIAEKGLVINPQTKTATTALTMSDNSSLYNTNLMRASKKKYHYGVNKVTVHWNYIRIYMDKTLTKNVAAGITVGLSGLIGGAVSGPAAAGAAGAIGGFVGSAVGNSIKGGIWIDYNYYQGVTNWGLQ